MVRFFRHVAEEGWRAVHVVDDDVDAAVVEEVAEGHAAGDGEFGEAAAFDGRDELELAADVVEELGALGPGGAPVLLVDGGVDVAVDDEEVEPAIVVVVEEGGTPAEERDGGFGDAGLVADVGEVGVAVVAVEGFVVVGEGGVEEIDEAGVGVVAGGDAHAGGLAAALVEGVAGGEGGVFEGAVALVEVEVVGGGVVGDEEVGFAVVVDVDKERRKAIEGVFVGDTGAFRGVGEGAVAVVVEEVVGLADEAARTAHDGSSAELAGGVFERAGVDAGGHVEVDVARDEEIESAVAVVVAPGGAGGPGVDGYAGLLGDVGEGAVVVVAIEAAFAEVRDEEVGPAIVVEVAGDGAEAPTIVGDAGLGRDVGEGAVVIVVEEGGVRGGGFAGFGLKG